MIELNTTRTDPLTMVVSGPPWASPITLVKCPIAPGAEATRDPHQALDEARALDTRIAHGGQRAPAERAHYFRAGETEPFLISDPTGSYAFFAGRLVTTFAPGGAIQPELPAAEAARRERELLQQARTIRAVAENLRPPSDQPGDL